MEKEHKEHKIRRVRINPWQLVSLALGAIVLLGYFNGYYFVRLAPAEAADAAEIYLQEELGLEATVTNVTDVGSGIYKLSVALGGQTYESYMTNDGNYLFPTGFKTRKIIEKEANITLPGP